MKTMIRSGAAFLMALTLIACEGPMGPEGPVGPQGEEGPGYTFATFTGIGNGALLEIHLPPVVGTISSPPKLQVYMEYLDGLIPVYNGWSSADHWWVLGPEGDHLVIGILNSLTGRRYVVEVAY